MTSDVLLWTSERDTWSFGHPILMAAHESTTANVSFISNNRWCALPPNKTLATRSAYKFPKFIFLDLPRDVIRSVAHFRLRVHTLRLPLRIMTRIYFEEALYGGVCSRKEKKRKMKNYAGSENHSPHRLRKRSHFGSEYRKAPPTQKGKEN